MELAIARIEDVDEIMDILSNGRAFIATLGIDQWQGGYPQRKIIEDDIADMQGYVVNDRECIVGTAMIAEMVEEDYRVIEGAWLNEGEDARYVAVHRVAVKASHRSKGVAGFILKEAESIARKMGCESVRIDTHPGNIPMQKLLVKHGYKKCGSITISHAEEATSERFAYEKLV